MIIRAATIAGLALLLAATPALGQARRATPGEPEARVALELFPAKERLTVTSPAFKDGADIPFENTQYRSNTFPGLAWSQGPTRTKSYAVIMQDNDLLVRGAPVLHWTLFNIPANVTTLEIGMIRPPVGASYGPNYKGPAFAYTGPRTPPGPKDHYHFQVFALDTIVPAEAGSSYAVLTDAIRDHVLASGEVVGMGEKDPDAPMPPSKPPKS